MAKIAVLKRLVEFKTFLDSDTKKEELLMLAWSVWQSDCALGKH